MKNFVIIFFVSILIFSIALSADTYLDSNPITPQNYQKLLEAGIDVNWVIFNKVMSAYKSV
jgi:hypothetical protein